MADAACPMEALLSAQDSVGFDSLQYDDQIAHIDLKGAGQRTRTGISAKLFTSLYEAGVNFEMISTSEIRISVVTRADSIEDAARAGHTAFELDGDEPAVVHAGSGR